MTALLALCAGWWRHWRWSTSAIRSTVPQRSATCCHSCMICSVPPAIWRCVGIIVMVIFITITFIFTLCHYRYYIKMYMCFMVLTVKWLELWTWISVNFFIFLSNIFWNLMSDRSTAIHRAPDFVFIIISKLFFVILKFSESCYKVWVPDDLELAG